jgi:hypothetical protein
MSAYLENYLESVSTLPGELSRNFSLVRELDEQSQQLLDKVEAAMVRYRTSDAASAAEIFTDDAIQDLRNNLTTCVALGDERVSLALQTYELVDKHIRRLDQDLKRFEHELDLQKKEQSTSYAKPKRLGPAAQAGILPSAPIPNSSQPFQAAPPAERPEGTRSRKAAANLASGQYEMPIDPNEPTYCICNGYSSGTMVGCDNREACSIEWFHVECVGLTGPVKGKWICPICREKEKEKKKAAF